MKKEQGYLPQAREHGMPDQSMGCLIAIMLGFILAIVMELCGFQGTDHIEIQEKQQESKISKIVEILLDKQEEKN